MRCLSASFKVHFLFQNPLHDTGVTSCQLWRWHEVT